MADNALAPDVAALIQAAVTAAVAGAQPVIAAAIAGAQQAPAAPVAFALTPAGAGNVPWNFQTTQGTRMYTSATEPIDPRYDGTVLKLNGFLRQVSSRVETFGFTSILVVPDSEGVNRDLTREAGCLTMDNVRDKALLYLRLEERDRQASELLRLLIVNSMDTATADRLFHRRDNYTINVAAAVADPPDMRVDGPCMLKDLIAVVSVETRATIALLTRQITNLEPVMEDAKSNITEFNAKVKDMSQKLLNLRAPVPELLTHLFTSYKTCEDAKFVRYINRKEEEFEDGSITVTSTRLMELADEKYKIIVEKQEWCKKSEEELDFIAMEATIVALTSEVKELKQNPPKTKQPSSRKSDVKAAARNVGKYAWKMKVPGPNEPHEQTRDGKDYIYCPHHANTKWVLRINQQGVDHKTGCREMAEAIKAKNAKAGKAAGKDDKLIAAVANVLLEEENEDEEL